MPDGAAHGAGGLTGRRVPGGMRIHIVPAGIVTAFDAGCVGSKVVLHQTFSERLNEATAAFEFPENGQGFVPLPGCEKAVSAGVGLRTSDPAAYVVREWRGRAELFLKREHALTTESVAAIVYTLEAYLRDPDVKADEAAEVRAAGATHVLVAVLASAGPRPALSPHRLTANLAGGNNEALAWDAEQIRAAARASVEWDSAYCVVAD